jgi:ABC-type transporter Mla subunit MlaD
VRRALALLLALLTASCVSPSRTDRDYELKAGNSAKAVASSVATALLGVEAARRHRATGPYLSVLLGSAEEDASSVQSQFDSVQPPSAQADAQRAKLDDLLSQAVAGLSQLRITVRRGELDKLDATARPLRGVLVQLRKLSEEWQ